jgi:HEAT repeat protein
METNQRSTIEQAIELLSNSRSPNRRMGAKRLRKLKDPSAGPALLIALQKEVQDPRTWETQYQMIMALGVCEYKPALPFLKELAGRAFEATMIYLALGDAIVRLAREQPDDPAPVLWALGTHNDMVIDGAFRAVAMLRLRLNPTAIAAIIGYVRNRSLPDPLRFWVAAACAGWSGPEVEQFLEACTRSPRQDIKQAALAAQQRKYLRWNPL